MATSSNIQPANFTNHSIIGNFHTQQHMSNGMQGIPLLNFPPNLLNFLGALQNYSPQSNLAKPSVPTTPLPSTLNSSRMDVSESSSSTVAIPNNDGLVDKLVDLIVTNDKVKAAILDIAKGAVAASNESTGDDAPPKPPTKKTFVKVKVVGEEPYEWKVTEQVYKNLTGITNPTTMLKAILEQIHPIEELRKMTLTGVNRRNEECTKLPRQTLDIVTASLMKYLWSDRENFKMLPDKFAANRKKFCQDVRALLTRNLHWYKTTYDLEGNRIQSTSKSISAPTSGRQRKRATNAATDDDESSDINDDPSPAKRTAKTSREFPLYQIDDDDAISAGDDGVFDSDLDMNAPISPHQSSSTSLLDGQNDDQPSDDMQIFSAKYFAEENVNLSEKPATSDCSAVTIPPEHKHGSKAKAIAKALKQHEQAGPSSSVCDNVQGEESQPDDGLFVDSAMDTPAMSLESILPGGVITKAKGPKGKKASQVIIPHAAGRAPSKRISAQRSAAKVKGLAGTLERSDAGGLVYDYVFGPM